jgi:hypothetical protein
VQSVRQKKGNVDRQSNQLGVDHGSARKLLMALWRLVTTGEVLGSVALRAALPALERGKLMIATCAARS